MSEAYQFALLLGAVWIYGTIAGTLLTVAGRRFLNPWVGRHRRGEDR